MAIHPTQKSRKRKNQYTNLCDYTQFQQRGGNTVIKDHMWGNKELGSKIRELRLQSNLTLRQLGDICGISWSTIQQFETGKRNIQAFSLECIIEGLGYELIIQKR